MTTVEKVFGCVIFKAFGRKIMKLKKTQYMQFGLCFFYLCPCSRGKLDSNYYEYFENCNQSWCTYA